MRSSTGSIVKAGSLRTTLHVMCGRRVSLPRLGVHRVGARPDGAARRRPGGAAGSRARRAGHERGALRARLPRARDDDRWTVAFAYRALPFVRTAPVGAWPHTKPSPFVLWREPLPEPRESATASCAQYLAAYGPASRDDIAQFTGFKVRQIDPALEGLRDASPTSRGGRSTTLAGAARGRRCACSGALPAGVRLDHPRAPRPLADRPDGVPRRGVQQEERDDEEHVHGRRVRRRRVANREATARARSAASRHGPPSSTPTARRSRRRSASAPSSTCRSMAATSGTWRATTPGVLGGLNSDIGLSFSGAGQREIQNSLSLDGINASSNLLAATSMRPIADAVTEIQVQTGSTSAEYGSYLGVAINVVTKSGTNDLHGSLSSSSGTMRSTPAATSTTRRIRRIRCDSNQFGFADGRSGGDPGALRRPQQDVLHGRLRGRAGRGARPARSRRCRRR